MGTSEVVEGSFSDVKYTPDGRLFAILWPEDAMESQLVEIVAGQAQPRGGFGYAMAVSPVPEPSVLLTGLAALSALLAATIRRLRS